MRRLAGAFVLLFVVGCAAGPFTFGVTRYRHTEIQGDTSWETVVTRPWGTSSVEFLSDTKSERGSVSGQGMSNNLQKTIGEDAFANGIKAGVTAARPGGELEDVLGDLLRNRVERP